MTHSRTNGSTNSPLCAACRLPALSGGRTSCDGVDRARRRNGGFADPPGGALRGNSGGAGLVANRPGTARTDLADDQDAAAEEMLVCQPREAWRPAARREASDLATYLVHSNQWEA